jgi:hypothetical protein
MPDGPPSDGIPERPVLAVVDEDELRGLSGDHQVSPERLRQAIKIVGSNPQDVARYLRWASAADDQIGQSAHDYKATTAKCGLGKELKELG